MNSVIETLNTAGNYARQFAWPMLWQSSLLIVVVFGLDLALRNRVRAGVRYGLWMLIPIKLLLPPSLALPTSLSWWVHPATVPSAGPAVMVVTHQVTTLGALPVEVPAVPAPVQAAPHLSFEAGCLLISVAVSLALLLSLVRGWRRVSKESRRAQPAPAELSVLIADLSREAGLRCPVDFRLTEGSLSPALFGLLRPVILIPRSLVEQVPAAHLRGVISHELIHLRRKDSWINCAQALLQIAYWWHPLLWMANARIRRLREESVDDAVMLRMGEQAQEYPMALLTVARLALRRPLATLGLVGVFESRGSLKRRIERLLNSHPPRRAGLTLGSMVCILAFGAVALPMGDGPASPLAPASNSAEPAHESKRAKPQTGTNAAARPGPDGAIPAEAALPQVQIRSLFLLVSNSIAVDLWKRTGMENGTSNQLRILSGSQAQETLKWLEQQNVDVLNFGGVTTLSGRQTQMSFGEVQPIAAGIDPSALVPPGLTNISISSPDLAFYSITNLSLGPILDIIPTVAADGWTFHLSVRPHNMNFKGYDKPVKSVTVYANGRPRKVPIPRPRFQLWQTSADVDVFDGDTLLLVARPQHCTGCGAAAETQPDPTGQEILAIITPTIVDSAGNRVHPSQKPPK
jgi:beta-lactamase regulating signal transducer with metallopeptidase domain